MTANSRDFKFCDHCAGQQGHQDSPDPAADRTRVDYYLCNTISLRDFKTKAEAIKRVGEDFERISSITDPDAICKTCKWVDDGVDNFYCSRCLRQCSHCLRQAADRRLRGDDVNRKD